MKPKTLKEWAARKSGRSGNTKRGAGFEAQIAAELGGAGWACDVVEISRQMIVRRGRSAWITKKADAFGCIDITAVKPGEPVLFIQATLDDSASMMRRKAAEIEKVFVTRSDGRRVLIVQPAEMTAEEARESGLVGIRYRVHELIAPGQWSRALLANVEERWEATKGS